MKAAILTKLNSPLEIADVELTPPKVGQVVIKNIVSGLCGSQLLEIKGEKNNAKFLPHLMGHEGCGIVQEIGDGVTKVKQGDKVVMHWIKSNGIESDFPSYVYNGKTIRSGKVTTLSEYSIVSENRLTVVPPDTNPEVCALLGCSLTTALGVINNDANVKFGESVVVLGCGGVGLNLIRGANMAGAYPIIGVDASSDKEAISKQMGCSHFVNIKNTSLRDLIDKNGADVIIDTTGNVNVMKNAIPLLSDFGRFIMVGHPSKENDTLELVSSNHMFGGSGKTIKASQGGQTNPQVDIPRYVKLFSAGLLNIDDLITNRYHLNQINDAIDTLRTGKSGRIIIKCHE